MSDLAPFVAAALRDRTVEDLNNELREEREARLVVQITGPSGNPVYYESSLLDGASLVWGTRWGLVNREAYTAESHADTSIPLPVNAIESLEIRLGGVVVHHFDRDLFFECMTTDVTDEDFDREKKKEPQMGGFYFSTTRENTAVTRIQEGPVAIVNGRIGPMRWKDYEALDDYWTMLDFYESGKEWHLVLTGLEFYKSHIPGIMSLLKKMGIDTERPYHSGGIDEDDDTTEDD